MYKRQSNAINGKCVESTSHIPGCVLIYVHVRVYSGRVKGEKSRAEIFWKNIKGATLEIEKSIGYFTQVSGFCIRLFARRRRRVDMIKISDDYKSVSVRCYNNIIYLRIKVLTHTGADMTTVRYYSYARRHIYNTPQQLYRVYVDDGIKSYLLTIHII